MTRARRQGYHVAYKLTRRCVDTPGRGATRVTGDANRLYYSQTRSRREVGLFHFSLIRREAYMATRTDRQIATKRAAIYARVSDKSQDTEDKTSISEQISDMEAHCERRGLTITARYQEVGRGWSKNRPEFQRMLADARRGRFDTIVCWKSDRISRGMYPAAALMEVVEAYQIELEAVLDAIDMKTFGLMAAIGKIELDNFRERASMGKRGSAKQGRIPANGVPYGYRIGDDGKPEVVEAEAEIVQRIFKQYARDGIGIPLIVQQLIDDEVPTGKPESKRWHESHVHRILRNEAYKGIWWYGKTRQVATEVGRKIYEQPKDTWIQVPFPPLVTEETWDKVQNIKKRRKSRAKRNTKVFYMLQHLVRCAECGMLMGGRAAKQNTVRRNGRDISLRLGSSSTILSVLRNAKAAVPLPQASVHQGGTVGGLDLERGQASRPKS